MITVFGSVAQDIFAIAAVISSLLVITSKNPVISVLFLISVFVNSAVYLMFTGIHFISIAYIIVYVGAIAILFLFILMMINIKLTDILEVGTDYTKNLPAALIIAGVFIFAIFGAVANFDVFQNVRSVLVNFINTVLIQGTLNTGGATIASSIDPATIDSYLRTYTQIDSIGHTLYTTNAALLILTSLILLLSMLAPIMLSSFYKKVT